MAARNQEDEVVPNSRGQDAFTLSRHSAPSSASGGRAAMACAAGGCSRERVLCPTATCCLWEDLSRVWKLRTRDENEQRSVIHVRVVGIIATALAGTGVLVAAVTALFSVSDARRYLRIRKM